MERAEATNLSDIAMIMNGPALGPDGVLAPGKVPGIKQLEEVEDRLNPAFDGGRLAGVRFTSSLPSFACGTFA